MGFRFNRRIKLCKGLSLNLGKKSAGLRIGMKGLGVSFNTKGTVTKSVGIPGTGLSYRSTSKIGDNSAVNSNTANYVNSNVTFKKPLTQRTWFILLMLLFIAPFGIYLAWRKTEWKKPVKIAVSALSAFLFLSAVINSNSTAPVAPANNAGQKIAVSSSQTAPSFNPISESTPNTSTTDTINAAVSSSETDSISASSASEATQQTKEVAVSSSEVNSVSASSDAPQQSKDTPASEKESPSSSEAIVPAAAAAILTPSSQESVDQPNSQSNASTSSRTESDAPVYASEPEAYMVWIPTKGGTKYHTSSTCSNMNGPHQVTLEEAKAAGFEPCGRCHPRS
ncbi:MAG: DUF4236 domain-containing protein [Candidatus Fimivivens sp.]|nr:DUF4236 domain-containing protein [Candidatus Fimivivens sp.]